MSGPYVANLNLTVNAPSQVLNISAVAPAQTLTVGVAGMQGAPGFYTSLLGTTNEVNIAFSGTGGTVATFSLPQAIATSSSPSFNGLSVTGGTMTVSSATNPQVLIQNTSNGQHYAYGYNLGSTVFGIYDSTAGTWRLQIADTTGVITIPTNVASTSPTTGSLTVVGGVGIVGAVYAGSVYDNSNRVVTSLTAGTDIAITGTAPSLTINDTSTLQTVCSRGSTTTTSLTAGVIAANAQVYGHSIIPTYSSVPTNGMFLPNTNQVGFSANSLTQLTLSTSAVVVGNYTYDPTQHSLSCSSGTIFSNNSIVSTTYPAIGFNTYYDTTNNAWTATVTNNYGYYIRSDNAGNLVIYSVNNVTTAGSSVAAQTAAIASFVTGSSTTSTGGFAISRTTASTSTTTGALTVAGGAGIGGAVYASSFNGAGTGLTGTAASLTVGAATNATSATTSTNISGGASNSLVYQTGSGATGFIAPSTNGYQLTMVSGAPAWAPSAATTATNLSGGSADSIPYQTAAGATSFIAAGSNGQILTMVSGVPAWAAAPVGTSITGTANQITASSSTGAVTLSLPANIVTTSAASGTNALVLNTANSAFGATATTNATLLLQNSSSTAQTNIDFAIGSTLNGRIRNDYAGNMNYVATASGMHDFFVGGDSGTGSTVLQLSSAGAGVTGSLGVSTYINVGGGTASTTAGDITVSRAGGTTGVIFFGNSSQGKYLYFDGTQYNLPGAALSVGGNVQAASFNGCTIPAAGSVPGANGIPRTDANGYLYTYYINDSSPTETFTPTYIYGNNGSDNFIRRTAQSNVTAGACSGNSATVTCYGGRTDPTAYPILWANPGSTTASQPTYACSAVTITSSTGTVTASGFTTSSDRNKKDNIRLIVNAEEIVQNLNGVRFDWKANGLPSAGVIAQDVEAVLPELVTTDDEGAKSVNYNGLIGVLIEEVKALRKELNALKAR
jgi:hypothetical protein